MRECGWLWRMLAETRGLRAARAQPHIYMVHTVFHGWNIYNILLYFAYHPNSYNLPTTQAQTISSFAPPSGFCTVLPPPETWTWKLIPAWTLSGTTCATNVKLNVSAFDSRRG